MSGAIFQSIEIGSLSRIRLHKWFVDNFEWCKWTSRFSTRFYVYTMNILVVMSFTVRFGVWQCMEIDDNWVIKKYRWGSHSTDYGDYIRPVFTVTFCLHYRKNVYHRYKKQNFSFDSRFGRKSLLIGSLILSGISGMVTSFSVNYWMYATMEFITSMCAAGIYMSVFILGLELVGANKRVLGGTIIAQIFAVGQVILGFMAMHITNYRYLLRTIYLPTALVLSYIWCIPESVRWLMSKGQNKKALKILYKAAKTNHVELSNSTLDSMYEFSDNATDPTNNTAGTSKSNAFLLAIRSRVIMVRFLICCFCWFTNGFVYYGISVHAVTLDGNKYNNFMLVSFAEVPAIVITYFLMQNFRRKWSLQAAMLVCAAVCIASEFVSDFSPVWKLIFFGIGKCSISIAFTVSYVFTTELFPTNLRQSFMSSCNMV